MPDAQRAAAEEGEVREDRAMDRCHAVGLVMTEVLRHLGPRRLDVFLDDRRQCAPGLVQIGAVHAHAVPATGAHLHGDRPAPVGGLRTPLDLDGRAVAIGGVIEVADEVIGGELPVAGYLPLVRTRNHLCPSRPPPELEVEIVLHVA